MTSSISRPGLPPATVPPDGCSREDTPVLSVCLSPLGCVYFVTSWCSGARECSQSRSVETSVRGPVRPSPLAVLSAGIYWSVQATARPIRSSALTTADRAVYCALYERRLTRSIDCPALTARAARGVLGCLDVPAWRPDLKCPRCRPNEPRPAAAS